MASINVRVQDKETLQELTITYKAYRDTAYRFNLLGQVDDQGNLMESDPNLNPQHQRKLPVKSAGVDVGVTHAPISDLLSHNEDFISVINPPDNPQESTSDPEKFHVEQSDMPASEQLPSEPVKERKKPGPKPKNRQQ